MSTTHRESGWRGQRPRARHGGAKRRSVGEWEGRRLGRGAVAPPQYGGLRALPPENFKFNNANLFIFKLQGLKYLKMSTHSTNVNCTLDKVNCTLCVRKHTILGPEVSYQTNITKLSFNLNAQCHEDYFPSFCVQSYAHSDNVSSIH